MLSVVLMGWALHYGGSHVNTVRPGYLMVSRITIKSERVRHWTEVVQDSGYVLGDKPVPGIKSQTNYFFAAQLLITSAKFQKPHKLQSLIT